MVQNKPGRALQVVGYRGSPEDVRPTISGRIGPGGDRAPVPGHEGSGRKRGRRPDGRSADRGGISEGVREVRDMACIYPQRCRLQGK